MDLLVFVTVGLSGKCRPLVGKKQRFILHKKETFFYILHFYDSNVNLLNSKPGKNVLNKISLVMNTEIDLWKHLSVRRALMF